MMEGINAKYVSQKISKTRWRPVSSSSLQQPDIFATGSWDNEDNKISIWSIGENGISGLDNEFEGDPQLVCEHKHNGDVLDLQFLDQDRIVTASSTGAVIIFRHHHNSQTLSVSQLWERAHHYPCDNAPCTGIVCNSPEIVTVGEDGRIILFRADQEGVLRTIENADSSTIHDVTFLRTTEILTVNSIGQLKIWDFRQQGNEPSQILSLTGDRVPLHCVDRHPNQQHIVATGGQDGMLCIWDVRQGNMPFSLMEAHSAEMWEVHFHPSNPDHLFSCSEDGSLLHWETSSNSDTPSFLQGGRNTSIVSRSAIAPAGGNQSLISSWLTGDSSKGRLETTHMLPSQTLSVNSLDVLGQCLVCGTDGEAIYVNRRVPI
ncbi:nucleoporin Nup43 [Oncorhynchus tshawytscha]|uniref:Nucleoporin Nup43 n=1 Tax=Oncorhynchus tshawytscha TaxID=74940 RepID=A0A8C8GDS5_ONCTS|nr:nucleoporin Nup43 [Oncorhynchus tshawytscha]